MLDTIALEPVTLKTVDQFKEWTRRKIRPLFPHETLGCGYGHLHAGGVGLDCVVTIDYPTGHLHGIRNKAGGIDTPVLRRWLATREPQLFEIDDPWPDVPAVWLESFREHGMKNAAALGVYDTDRCVGTYHSFHRIPGRLSSANAEALKRIVPVMHEVLCGVIEQLTLENGFATRYAGLSLRDKELAQWVGLGKTNGEIAILTSLSENTVKHRLTGIFDQLALETRAQLVYRLTEYETKTAPGFGTKIL